MHVYIRCSEWDVMKYLKNVLIFVIKRSIIKDCHGAVARVLESHTVDLVDPVGLVVPSW